MLMCRGKKVVKLLENENIALPQATVEVADKGVFLANALGAAGFWQAGVGNSAISQEHG